MPNGGGSCDGIHGLRVIVGGEFRREEVLGAQAKAAPPCFSQKQLLCVRWDQTISSAASLRISPATNLDFGAAGHVSDGAKSAADRDDCDCRFHGATIAIFAIFGQGRMLRFPNLPHRAT